MFKIKRGHSGRIVQSRAAHVNQIRTFHWGCPMSRRPDRSSRVNLFGLTLPNGRAKLSSDIVIIQPDISSPPT